ncbi:MAG: multicopper oxidase domain-containing protein [Nocardioidaceae bacterium]|nr:multicopper oxidase domain-containing protein [Nocardioidaceae bacterium]
MSGMRYSQPTIQVPAGNRLVITLRNDDKFMVHDLVLDSGAKSGRLSPGGSATVDVGVVEHDIAGWCSVPGHRQMGMTLDIVATGADAQTGGHVHRAAAGGDAADDMDLMADPGPGFKPYDAVLPPLRHLAEGQAHHLTLTIEEHEKEVAPGVRQKVWTFGGTDPGPVLHGEVGDTFEVTLVNHGGQAHGIDFHAGSIAPDSVMRPIPPGKSLVYRFTANRAGIWMYHCSTMPMSLHVANGMFGAVVIEPPGLPRVDRSYVLVQNEQYFGPQGGSADPDKIKLEQPDTVDFNGYPNQYDHAPLPAKVGERVRVWVLAAGPSRGTSFHVVGTQFDRVYFEGSYLLDGGSGGSQALALAPAQGGFVEMTFPQPGHYPFVSHAFVDAERGAHGFFEVSKEAP